MRKQLLAGLVALAANTWSYALAETVAPPPPPPPGATPAVPPPSAQPTSPSGMVTSINIDALKGIFAAANIPIQEGSYADNWPYFDAKLQGYGIRTYVVDCAGKNVHGTCSTIVVESVMTAGVTTAEQLNAFNRTIMYAKAVAFEGDKGHALLQSLIRVSPGVAQGSIEASYRQFTAEMTLFFDTMAKTADGNTSTASGFSTAQIDVLKGSFSAYSGRALTD